MSKVLPPCSIYLPFWNWLQVTTPLMSCTNRIVSGFCVMIKQCCQYNLQRLTMTINIAMCFFMSCLNYFIVFLWVFFMVFFVVVVFCMLSKGGWYFSSLRVWQPCLWPQSVKLGSLVRVYRFFVKKLSKGEIVISSSGMTTPFITSVNP